MKNKRKDILYIAVGVAFVFAVYLVVSYLLPSTVGISEHADAKIKYITENKNIEVTLDDSDCACVSYPTFFDDFYKLGE